MRGALAALLTIAISASLGAQPPSAGYLVHIDVFATDARGRTVSDLKPADFELREDGAMQALQSVRFVDNTSANAAAPSAIQSADDERAAAKVAGARVFALFLDEY